MYVAHLRIVAPGMDAILRDCGRWRRIERLPIRWNIENGQRRDQRFSVGRKSKAPEVSERHASVFHLEASTSSNRPKGNSGWSDARGDRVAGKNQFEQGPPSAHNSRCLTYRFAFLWSRRIGNGVDKVLPVADIESLDHLRRRCQRLDFLGFEIGQNEPMIAFFGWFQKSNPAGVGEPLPSPDDTSFLASALDGPNRRRLRCIGMTQKVIDVTADVKVDFIFDTVDSQPSAFCSGNEIVSIRREQDLGSPTVCVVKKCQSNLVSDREAMLRLLYRRTHRIRPVRAYQRNDQNKFQANPEHRSSMPFWSYGIDGSKLTLVQNDRGYELKHGFESELHRARAARLVEGTQDTERTSERGCRLTECVLAQGRINSPKIGIIEGVECFRSELQFKPFMNPEVPADCQVHLPRSKAPREVPWSISVTRADTRKGVWINRATAGTWKSVAIEGSIYRGALGTVNIHRLTRNQIKSFIEKLIRRRVHRGAPIKGHRKRASCGEPVVETPVMHNGVHKTVISHVRHVIRERGGKIVSDVESAVTPLVIAIHKVLRSIVHAVRPCVGSQGRQPSPQSPTELNLQCIVVRRQAIVEELETSTCAEY